jgi:2,4-diaminopentanoate dehydrogenase
VGDALKVVQWTTGTTGRAAVAGVVAHGGLELVGCWAWSPDKVGRDVGELCGLAPLGLAATDDVDALLALRPDCVVYTPFRPDVDHVERILAAGVNVVTTMYMLSGTGYGDEVARRVADACAAGRSTLYAGGIYPGHAPNVALAASAMCRRIDRLSVLESLDVQGYANEAMFRAMGFDLELDDPDATQALEAACGSFRDQIPVMAAALGVALDDVAFTAELAAADVDTDLGFMTLRRGRVAGFRGTVAGMVGRRSVIECRFVWKLGDAMTPNWPVTDGYVVEIEGDPGVRVRIEGLDGHLDGATTTVMPLVNAIPAVCAAAPGVLNRAGLPFVTGSAAAR